MIFGEQYDNGNRPQNAGIAGNMVIGPDDLSVNQKKSRISWNIMHPSLGD